MTVKPRVVRQSAARRQLVALLSAILLGLVGFGVFAYTQITVAAANTAGSGSASQCDTAVSVVPGDPVFSSSIGHFAYPQNVTVTGIDSSSCLGRKVFVAAVNTAGGALASANPVTITNAAAVSVPVPMGTELDAESVSDWAVVIKSS